MGAKSQMEPYHRRAMAALFGENPTSAQRLAYRAVTALRIALGDLDDLSDEDLRAALHGTIVRILRSAG